MPLRCLLIGPSEEGEQVTGEDAYVHSLLSDPPSEVEYVHYSRLLSEGKARRQRWVHALFSRLERFRYLRPAPWLETLTSDEDFDLVHVHGFDVRLAGRIAARPVILGTSSYGPTNCDNYLGWGEKKIIRYHRRLQWLFRLFRIYDACNNLRNAKCVIVWSEYARNLHLRAGRKAERVTVIPPGIDVPLHSSTGFEDKSGVLFVGRDFTRKGGDLLLKAWGKVSPGAARLTLVGGGEADLPQGVEHYPYVSPLALQNYFYMKSQIFAFPTRADGYGMVVLEAMAHGLAVVASRIGAMPEIVSDGETGFLVPPGEVEAFAERLQLLLDQPLLCRKMGEAGRQRALSLFGLERRNLLLEEVYRAAA